MRYPTCRSVPVEIAHIVPWTKNLIALCPTCHAPYDKGDIDRKAMRQYKANLSVMHGRYGDVEQRVFRLIAEQGHVSESVYRIDSTFS